MSLFKVMSYNVWFDPTDREERLEALISVIGDHAPDVVCLQEVIPDVYRQLSQTLGDTYAFVFPARIEVAYGCCILSRHPIVEGTEIEFPESRMGRRVTAVVIDTGDNNGERIVVATSHFESEFKRINPVKTTQYIQARQVLDKLYGTHGPVVLCADTNILRHEEKYWLTADPLWSDAWRVCGADPESEYTYDTKTNINLMARDIQKEIRSRIDRIVYRGASLTATDFTLVKGRIEKGEPSDHFGILATLELGNNTVGI